MDQDKLKEIARIFFDYGKSWGECYSTGFIPTEEDHDGRFNELFEKLK